MQEKPMTLKPGDRIQHQTRKDAFGPGEVLSVDERAGTVLVRWDKHNVTRATDRLSKSESHVNITSVMKVNH
jgi:hypothetical protein